MRPAVSARTGVPPHAPTLTRPFNLHMKKTHTRDRVVGKDRRRQQRFLLVLPVRLTVIDERRHATVQLRTRDLSSVGAFLESGNSYREGTKVEVEFLLTVRNLLDVIRANTGAEVRVSGKVIRLAEEGFAVAFSKGFRIRPAAERFEERSGK